MKICSACKQEKELSSFYNNRNTKDGMSSACVECSRRRSRAAAIKYRYGLSLEQYQAMLEVQGHACAACGIQFDGGAFRPEVDHDHKCCAGTKTCGKCVRGILCPKCNSMAGAIEYNLPYLDDVLRYLTFNLMKQLGEISPDIYFSKNKLNEVDKYLNSFQSEVK